MILGLVICVIVLIGWCYVLDSRLERIMKMIYTLDEDVNKTLPVWRFNNFINKDRREKEAFASSILDLRAFTGFDPLGPVAYREYKESGNMDELMEKQNETTTKEESN